MAANITGERLKALRLERDWSQSDVAKQINIERVTYLNYEKGNSRPVRRLKELANLFGVSIDYLMGTSDERNPVAPSAPAARPLTLEDRERAIKEWLRAIAQAAGNEKALAAIERIKLVESTGELHLEDGSDLDNALLQLQATSLLTALEKAVKDGKTTAEWHAPSYSEKPNS